MARLPIIPEFIKVHLGPPESNAQDITVSFLEYIRNVASSEIYPTWPESALRANIYCQISFALNKVYTEYYPSRGYAFNITSSPAFDQSFVLGRNIFENINKLVGDIFTTYAKRIQFIEPLATTFCNGTTVTCDGLSQWGSVSLANQGYIHFDILTYYFGKDLELNRNTPVDTLEPSYPGTPLRVGDRGFNVAFIKLELNRISQNYPGVPKVFPVDGVFNEATETSVKVFQRIFNLTVDGIVGPATWYQLIYIYSGVKRLAELTSEGLQLSKVPLEFQPEFKTASVFADVMPSLIPKTEYEEGIVTSEDITILQYYLSIISLFYLTIPFLEINGIYDEQTKQSVTAFQKLSGLPETGIVDETTWNYILSTYGGIYVFLRSSGLYSIVNPIEVPYSLLRIGSKGDIVTTIQQQLNLISINFPNVIPVAPNGIYGRNTSKSVASFQKEFGLPETGIVDEATWDKIKQVREDIALSITPAPRQFPGMTLSEGMKDETIYNL